MRRLCTALFAGLLGVGLVLTADVPAGAAQAGWASFTFTGSSRDFAGTMRQPANGFPEATYTSDSIGGSVGVQTGATTFLPPQTPVAATYGTSQGEQYVNLRPNSQSGPPPSVTTYTFERPTPSSGWTFVLGDIDADKIQISATGVGGRAVTVGDFGFRSVFNYCAPGVSPKPGCAPPNNSGLELPSWDPATGVLDGNPDNLDTAGASAWFEPKVPLTSLTFTFNRDAGFPVYQTWFSALKFDLTGTVTAPAGQADDITLELYDHQGNKVAATTTAADGSYSFPGYATYDDYRVVLVRPTGLTSDDPLTQSVDLSDGDATKDFSLRAIVPVDVSGTVLDDDDNPVANVTLTLTDGHDQTIATTTSNPDGSYRFDTVAAGTGYTITATPPTGTTASGPRTFSVPADSETPITAQDFVVTAASTGRLSGTVAEQGDGPREGVLVTVTGGGRTYTARSGADGRWSLPELPLGGYTATVTAPDGTTIVGAAVLEVMLAAGDLEATADFVLRVPEPATYTASGTVTDDEGDPVADVDVVLTDPTTGDQTTVSTDDDGGWSVEDLEPATGYRAEVQVPKGYAPSGDTALSFTIGGDDVTGLDFTLVADLASSPSPSAAPTSTQPSATAQPVSDPGPKSGGLADTGGPSLVVGFVGLALLAGATTLLVVGRTRRARAKAARPSDRGE